MKLWIDIPDDKAEELEKVLDSLPYMSYSVVDQTGSLVGEPSAPYQTQDQASSLSDADLPKLTKEEIEARILLAERQLAEGKVKSHEKVRRQFGKSNE